MIRVNGVEVICPSCGGEFRNSKKSGVKCMKCGKVFSGKDSILLLFWPNEKNFKGDVTKVVKEFYENTPFPNYENIDSFFTLKQRAKSGVFARMLDDQIGQKARILEVGCGTGQLSNFLAGTSKRKVLGVDICFNSLHIADKFRKKTKIGNVSFVQMNLFKPVFKEGNFDVVICNGVLHHTGNPLLGFKIISRLVKPGGYIIVGLYNKYGRIQTDMRRIIFNLLGSSLSFIDPIMRRQNLGQIKKNAWYLDQYKNPHESKHTIDEVLSWFMESGFEFINSYPKLSLLNSFSEQEELFEKKSEESYFSRVFVQSKMIFSGGKDGGFFIMIGRKLS